MVLLIISSCLNRNTMIYKVKQLSHNFTVISGARSKTSMSVIAKSVLFPLWHSWRISAVDVHDYGVSMYSARIMYMITVSLCTGTPYTKMSPSLTCTGAISCRYFPMHACLSPFLSPLTVKLLYFYISDHVPLLFEMYVFTLSAQTSKALSCLLCSPQPYLVLLAPSQS